jgi:CheY-like chemotaxis protein
VTDGKPGGSSEISNTKKHLLLLAESDAENLSYLSTLLTIFNYRTAVARTAAEAVTLASGEKPSLIITALGLADTSGIDFVQQLKKNARTAGIPFITLRRQDDLRGRESSLELGATDCLDLPVAPELLYRAVQAATEIKPRTCIRIRTIQPVTVENLSMSGGEKPYTLDLSEGGMFLRTTEPAAVNTRLSVRFVLNGRKISTDTAVVYFCQAGRGPWQEPGMGLVFVGISPEDRGHIRQFISEEVMRGIKPAEAWQ